MTRRHTIGAVFARGGSKGVLDKNLRPVGGTSLVARAVAQAGAVTGVDRVILSTDSEAIAEEGTRAGAEVPWLRPAALADDGAPEWDSWRHLVGWLADEGAVPDHLLVVPCTAPLRAVEDLERCLEAAADPAVDVVITITEARRNPYFNMVTVADDGAARLVIEPERRVHRRQDAPPVFDIGTVAYVVRPAYVLAASSLFEGEVRAVEVPAERALDIDTELDLQVAEAMLRSLDEAAPTPTVPGGEP